MVEVMAGRAQRPRARRWLVVLAVLLLGCSLAAAAASAVTAKRTLDSVRGAQARALTIARAEVASGECISAAAHLRLATSRFARPAVHSAAEELRTACEQLAAMTARASAAQRKGDVAGVVMANLSFLQQDPAEGLADRARDDIRSALDNGTNVHSLPVPVCQRFDDLVSAEVFAIPYGELHTTRFQVQCAQAWKESGDDARLQASLDHLRRTLSGLVGVSDPRPVRMRTLRAAQSATVLVVSNPLRSAAELIVVGSRGETFVYTVLAPCNEAPCRHGTGERCLTNVSIPLSLPPGRYQVMWRQTNESLDGTHLGRWTLAAGSVYATCLLPDQREL